MSQQSNLELASPTTGPVECLGQTFPSDEARREHYLTLLAEKLKDPEFRKIEGFPIGEDEDILALSDPPYYTACPNPWIGEFIEHYGRPYDPKEKYHREPFAADVSEGKNHPIYNAHSYHTKVPHRAIMRYILHYTEPGDVVFDGFCGTGMTGVAAQLCGDRKEVQELGYRVDGSGEIYNESGTAFSKVGARRVILNDLSPSATFIAYNYNEGVCQSDFEQALASLIDSIEEELGDLYHVDGVAARHVVWSEVMLCDSCGTEIVFWDAGVDHKNQSVKTSVTCSGCGANSNKRKLSRAQQTLLDPNSGNVRTVGKYVPVAAKMPTNRNEILLSIDQRKGLVDIEESRVENWYPQTSIQKDIDMWYERDYESLGLLSVDQFYTRKNLRILAAIWAKIKTIQDVRIRNAVRFTFTAMVTNLSRMNRWRPNVSFPYNPLSGTLYVPSLSVESNVFIGFRNKGKRLAKIWGGLGLSQNAIMGNRSSAAMECMPDDSADYLFFDPPFGSNIIYSDLSLLHEGWLGVTTNTKEEAVVHRRKKSEAHTLGVYRSLMTGCFREAFRVLKPGRWITIEFSNTQASVWNAIQAALQEVGFVVANVAALDKQMGSFKAVTTTTAVKQDLVISAYKPNGGLEARFEKSGHSVEGVWDFLKTHLRNLPVVKPRGGDLEFIAERDPRILYDRMVAFYIGHGFPVPLSSAEFQKELAEKFPEREGMFFLAEQVAEWDKRRAQMQGVGQMSIFVEDEKSAIDWLRNFLKSRPSTYQDIQPEFMQTLGASWKKFETRPELNILLAQNFLKYEGQGEVPSQIHSYLSTQNKDLRNLPKDDARLTSRAKDRWFVPDPAKAVDVEAIRDKRLMQEFWELCDQAGISRPTGADPRQRTLGIPTPAANKTGRKKLKEVRTEAVRIGFKDRFAAQDYATILAIAAHLPDNVIEEDEQLQMIHDMAEMRSEG